MCDDQELSLRQMGELPQVTYVFSPTESRASSGSGCHREVTLQQQTVGCKFNSQSTEICMQAWADQPDPKTTESQTTLFLLKGSFQSLKRQNLISLAIMLHMEHNFWSLWPLGFAASDMTELTEGAWKVRTGFNCGDAFAAPQLTQISL